MTDMHQNPNMMTVDEVVRKARAAIGDAGPDDWKVDPTAHAREFEDKAPSLADNLRRSRPEGLARQFKEKDSAAVTARDRFKSAARQADNAVFMAGAFSAILIVAIGLQQRFGDYEKPVIVTLGILGAIASSYATMLVGMARRGKLAKRWAAERAGAESRRIRYFRNVLQGATRGPLDRLLALEYVRRFLLDSQLQFFRKRGRQHEQAAQTAITQSMYATFFASSVTGIASVLAIYLTDLGVLAGLSAVATQLGALILSRSEMNLDMQNAERYRKAADTLSDIRLDLDRARRDVAVGADNAHLRFFDPVIRALEADHKSFLKEGENLDSAMASSLENRLSDGTKEAEREVPGYRGNVPHTQPPMRGPSHSPSVAPQVVGGYTSPEGAGGYSAQSKTVLVEDLSDGEASTLMNIQEGASTPWKPPAGPRPGGQASSGEDELMQSYQGGPDNEGNYG